ncbi:hypothetical protein PanWU01x14_269090 [Parasponia andersonii]|uniref:Uncharacterized protein n=1 Tax=Parasponia andersonii TaxID=3476 RepID=A0A2P5B5Q4_PARAD|nr:hypothetical protein PanWU01x14_269090 [Parasponia andersonii]
MQLPSPAFLQLLADLGILQQLLPKKEPSLYWFKSLSSTEVASYFPQMDLSNFKLPPMEMNKLECVAKRFRFDKSKVADLKAKAVSCEQEPQLWRPLSRNT